MENARRPSTPKSASTKWSASSTAAPDPPYLSTTRRNENEIVIHYASQRRLCAFAKGIATGIARHYGESIAITELTCMQQGAATCEILLRRES